MWSHTVLQKLPIFWRKALFLSLFCYKCGSSMFIQNVGKLLPDNKESDPRRQHSLGQEVLLHSKSLTAKNSSSIIINDQKISSFFSHRPAFWPDHGTWPALSLWPCCMGGRGRYSFNPFVTRTGMRWVVNTNLQAPYPQERLSTHCTGSWVGHTAGLAGMESFNPPPGFDPPTDQPTASCYTNYAIPAASRYYILGQYFSCLLLRFPRL